MTESSGVPAPLRSRLQGSLRRASEERLLARLCSRGALSDEAADEIAEALENGEALSARLLAAGVPPAVVTSVERELAAEDFAQLPEAELPADVRAALLQPERVLDEFVLLEQIGRGGAGMVWRAWDRQLSRHVAIKRPRVAVEDWGTLERLRREALAAARLNHPNVVPIYKVGQAQGAPYLVMPLIEGQTLADLRPPLREAIDAVRVAALAIEDAHAAGLVHRDLKPSNLMRDNGGRIWVLDFGLAYLNEHQEGGDTRPGQAFGTAAYMSPEQAAGDTRARAPATDVYALGATLFDLCTGAPPFSGESFAAVLAQVLHDEPPRARQRNPALPADLETVLLRALAKEPERRYPSAGAFAEDLRRVLADEPIVARRPGFLERAGRHVRRARRVYAPAAAALVLVGAGFLYQRQAARLEREAAVETIRTLARSSLETALRLRRAGDLSGMRQALPALRAAYDRARSSDSAEIHYLMGRMYRALMDEEQALAHQERALAVDASYAPALYERVILLAHRYEREVQLVLGVQKPDADQVSIAGGLSPAELRRRLTEDAVRVGTLADAGQTLAVRGIVAYHSGDRAGARRLLDQAVQKNPTLEEAWETLAAAVGGWGAADVYTRAIGKDAGYLPFWTGRCRVRTENGKHEDAIIDAGHVLAADATQVTALLCRGRARMAWAHDRLYAGDDPMALLTSAEADFRAALKLEPRAWGAHWGIGTTARYHAIAAMRAGKDPGPALAASVAALDRTVALQPGNPGLWAARGRTKTLAAQARGDGDFRAAEADLHEALRLDPHSHTALDWLGELHAMRGLFAWERGADPMPAFAEAEATFARALAKGEGPPWTFYHRGTLAAWMGIAAQRTGRDPRADWERAERHLDQAIRLRGDIADFYVQRAEVRALLGRRAPGDAAADRLAALKLNPRIRSVKMPGPAAQPQETFKPEARARGARR